MAYMATIPTQMRSVPILAGRFTIFALMIFFCEGLNALKGGTGKLFLMFFWCLIVNAFRSINRTRARRLVCALCHGLFQIFVLLVLIAYCQVKPSTEK